MQIGILEPRHFSLQAQKELEKLGSIEFFEDKKIEAFLRSKEILFIRLKYKIDKSFLDMSPNLKYICTPTTGLNHLDINEVNIRGIKIISLKGESEFLSTIRATPEHTMGLLFALLRNYKHAFLNPENSIWNRDLYKGFELYGKTVGIIGMGRVGKILSKYFEVFGAKIVYTDIINIDAPVVNAQRVENIDSVIKKSDIILLTASYSKENEKMIDQKAIDLMKNKFFINTARGELVDENYLIEKISQGYFKGVGLDVINGETDPYNNLKKFLPLGKTNNFILTPHIAGATYESMWKTEEFIADKLMKKYYSQ